MVGEMYNQALNENRSLEEKKKALNIVNLLVEQIKNENRTKNN